MLALTPKVRRRLAVLAVSSACAGLLLLAGLRWIDSRAPKPLEIRRLRPPPPVRVADGREMSEIFAPLETPERPEEWAFHLDEKVAGEFFALEGPTQYDPWSYSRGRELHDVVMPWPEHPEGEVVTNTSSLGCRETHELASVPCDLRVLVAGDSHTFGVCNDDEVLTERLEVALRASHPGKSVEVLNAAYGGQSFLNYFGTWYRLREFRPQLFLVVVFGGNDFAELAGLDLYFTGAKWPPKDRARPEQREKALNTDGCAMAQGLDSIESGREWPYLRARIVRDAVWLCAEMKRTVEEAGTEFLVAFVPSPYVLQWPKDRKIPGWIAIDRLRIEEADYERERQQNRRFLDGLAAAGVPCVDLTPTFAAEPSPPYWRHDLHMSARAHELAARTLLPFVESRLAERTADR